MPTESIIEQIQKYFPASAQEEWAQTARMELAGKDPFDALMWSTADGLVFRPYYNEADMLSTGYSPAYQLKPYNSPYADARTWVNMPAIRVLHEGAANEQALQQLEWGADGILFDFSQLPQPDIEKLLARIAWPHCMVSFNICNKAAVIDLLDYTKAMGFAPDSLTGSFFWENISEIPDRLILSLHKFNKFSSLGIRVQPSTPVQEIAGALIKAVQLVDRLTEKKEDAEIILRQISFSISVGTNFLVEVAKLKALRRLWFQITQAYGVHPYHFNDLPIHVHSEAWTNELFQPHGNMIKGTLAALAAVCGGCQSLTVSAEDNSNGTMNRVARNISTILHEEAYVGKVADPLAGSYTIESMTSTLAEKAWEVFKSNESSAS